MQIAIIKEKIAIKMQAVENQFKLLDSYGENIPMIELDLMLEKVRNLYEDSYLLKNISSPYIKIADENLLSEKEVKMGPLHSETKAAIVEENVECVEHILKDLTSESNEIAENQEDERSLVAETIIPAPEIVTESKLAPEIIPENKSEQETEIINASQKPFIPDLFDLPPVELKVKAAVTQDSLHDTIVKQQQKEQILAEQLEQKKVTNLKAAIGINDKFLIINELFEGNMKAYEEEINRLNNFSSYNEAANYLITQKETKQWNEALASYNKLLNFIQRRYTA